MCNKLFIFGKINDISKIKKEIREKDLIISFDFETKDKLKNNGIKITPVNKYVDKYIIKEGLNWLKNWANKKSIENKSFKEFCLYNKISYWWFCDTLLWYHVLHKKNFYSLFYYTNIILNLVKKNKIEEIISYNNNDLVNDLLKEINKKYNIKIDIQSNKIKTKLQNNLPKFIEKLKENKFKIRAIVSKKVIRNIQKKDLIFTTYTSLCKNNEDIFLKDVVKEIKKYLNFNLIDLDYTKEIKNVYTGIKSREKNNYIPFEYFSSKNKKAKEIFKKKWNKIKNNLEFQRTLDYKNISFWNIMKPQFEFIFLKRFPEAANYVETSKKMLESLQPKIVFMTDETFMYGRSIVHAAKLNNTKTIALQHGLISKQSFEYINKKEKNKILDPPLPDITLVIGNYSKNLLTKYGNYKKVIITGQPRYESFNLEKEANIDDNKKITLISQPLMEEAAGDYVETAFGAFSELRKAGKDFDFVIKVHPREESIKYYQALSKKYKLPIEIIKNTPIDRVIEKASVIITMHSAVGIETLLLKKPLIILNTTKKEDIYPYSEGKKITKCENKDELVKVLSKVEKLKYDKEFLQDHIYFPSEGVVNKIGNIIKSAIKSLK